MDRVAKKWFCGLLFFLFLSLRNLKNGFAKKYGFNKFKKKQKCVRLFILLDLKMFHLFNWLSDEGFVKCFTRARFLNDLILPEKNAYIVTFMAKKRECRMFSSYILKNCQFLAPVILWKPTTTLTWVRQIKQQGAFLR